MISFFASVIVPAMRKITVRAPSASQATRKLPGPSSFRFVTKRTLPPRPPGVVAPNPSAPGNAGISFRSDEADMSSPRHDGDNVNAIATKLILIFVIIESLIT